MRFHPSSIGYLMSDPVSMDCSLLNAEELAIHKKKTKTDEEKELMAECKSRGLSQGAKTYLMGYAKEMLYGYSKVVTTKYMDKGLACEQRSIDLYNRVFFTRHTKHVGRRMNDYLTGECDIYVPGVRTIDTKTAWSLDTFPAIRDDCHDPLYEWQGRGYMELYEVPEHEVAFCMVSTPEELIRYEQRDLHLVDHIDPAMRVTRITYKRDPVLTQKMETKCRAAQQYLEQLVERIRAEHMH